MAIIVGNSNQSDTLKGTADADRIEGLSGNDVIFGGRGNDTIIGGSGSDVLSGGLDADTFQWSAGHITNGAVDYVTDFDLREGDTISFLASGGGQDIEIVSVSRSFLDTTTFNGVDLRNNVATGTDVTFTIKNTVTNSIQEVVLLDAYSGNLAPQWSDFLQKNFGLSGFSDGIV